ALYSAAIVFRDKAFAPGLCEGGLECAQAAVDGGGLVGRNHVLHHVGSALVCLAGAVALCPGGSTHRMKFCCFRAAQGGLRTLYVCGQELDEWRVAWNVWPALGGQCFA